MSYQPVKVAYLLRAPLNVVEEEYASLCEKIAEKYLIISHAESAVADAKDAVFKDAAMQAQLGRHISEAEIKRKTDAEILQFSKDLSQEKAELRSMLIRRDFVIFVLRNKHGLEVTDGKTFSQSTT